uniref:Si:ch211-194m7.3 n=1 Tax=Xiphophorus couchianus TaxID=32473 RepID=A0A3B5MZT0_9TELE
AFPHDKLQTAEGNATDCNTHITPQKLCFISLFLKIYLGTCQRGPLRSITGPGVNTQGEFSGNYAYGAWGRDPKPEMRKENWYWMVPLTSSQYANYIRFYPSLKDKIMYNSNIQIASSNPTTNTIQGPNNVLYGSALYYNCYNRDAVCRFNLTSKSIMLLNILTRTFDSNFCHLEDCYLYTDLDLATDESGVWVVYTTTEALGNLVLTKVEETEPPTLSKTWHTSVYKRSVTNTFLACGVLYATRYIDTNVEEVFYSFDTTTGMENFKVNIFINKVSPNIFSLNYNPVDQMLYAYSNAKMVSYKALFGYSDRYFS